MESKNRFFYANSNIEEIAEMLHASGFSKEEKMTEKFYVNLNLFFDRLDKEYFFVDNKNLKRISEIIRRKYKVELNVSSPSAIFGYENVEDRKERRKNKR